ncbi:hypothetical protein [Bifidobacterium miconisargentati]|uniref:hypothetical protein n=1 Tax=Bifidobacterium miconisargentati TaxID=2834437 RepID=UPI001BDCEECF|nr:hypothetical protein [Bifidobacterium miconisargentati]MBW3089254.1 hypothetical protein [Bifidobacterium miconisargentati]
MNARDEIAYWLHCEERFGRVELLSFLVLLVAFVVSLLAVLLGLDALLAGVLVMVVDVVLFVWADGNRRAARDLARWSADGISVRLDGEVA